VAHARWRARLRYPTATSALDGGGLAGEALDQAVADIARRRPDLVMAAN